jgi:WD40 repeat protein
MRGAPVLATMADQVQNAVQSLAFSPDGHTPGPGRQQRCSRWPTDGQTVRRNRPEPTATDRHSAGRRSPRRVLPGRPSTGREHPGLVVVLERVRPTPSGRPAHRALAAGASFSASAFSPDGQVLAVGSDSGRVWLWRVDGDRLIGSPTVFEAPGFAGGIAFSPDSHTVALADNGNVPGNGTGTAITYVQFWDVANPTGPILQAQFSVGNTFAGRSLAFSPDGQAFAIDANVVILWKTNPRTATVCGSIGDVITPAQWTRYVPNEPYNPPCGP